MADFWRSRKGRADQQIVELPSGELTFCHGKWPFIVGFPIKNGDFPWQNVSSPEGISCAKFVEMMLVVDDRYFHIIHGAYMEKKWL